jgi:hypothetical protein
MGQYSFAIRRRTARLRDCAARFRGAIEECDPKSLTEGMKDFPIGACGDATPLLGTYLTEQGLGTFTYVLGLRAHNGINGSHSHAWLEASGIIVDITADQFPEIVEKVIVSAGSDWHAEFERDGEAEMKADYRVFDEFASARLDRAYQAILAKLK